jgi:diguanylate cyclase (GGDEF)-like protein
MVILSSTVTLAWVAVVVAVLALAGALVLAVIGVRRAPRPVAAGLDTDISLRLRQLDDELGLTREESRRALTLGQLAWTLRLEDVLVRIADAAVVQLGVDAALAIAPNATGRFVRGGSGLSREERGQLAADPPVAGQRLGVRRTDYTRGPGEIGEGPPVVQALDVPITSNEGTLGLLMIFSRSNDIFTGDTLRELKELAAWAAPAITNARSFDSAERLADLDTRTGLHNKRYFLSALEREVGRAQRARAIGDTRELALLLFDLDDFKQINTMHGLPAGDAVLATVGERVRKALRRPTDIAAQYGGDEFAVLQPDATLDEAHRTYRYLQAEIEGPIPPVDQLSLSCGIAALQANETATSFLGRADHALRSAKQGGKGKPETAE